MDSSAWRGTDAHSEKQDKLYAYLKRENVSFIEPQMWPLNSSEINPVYWIMLFGVSFSNKPTNVDHLKQATVEEWNKLSQRFIDE